MHATCIKQDPTCIQTCTCLLHVAISEYMHVVRLFHVTSRDLGRFTGMLHACNMHVMLYACNMYVTCVLHVYCMHKHAYYMHATCTLHACYMHTACILHACYMRAACTACMLHARCMHTIHRQSGCRCTRTKQVDNTETE